MLATVEIQVLLAGQLVDCIRRQWRLEGVFDNGLPLTVIAIHGCTRGKQHALDTGNAHGFANVQGTDEVALMGLDRIFHRSLDRGHRSQVHHGPAACRSSRNE
ncbi:hypothetical protein D3C75_984210 [compost metagenome]